MQLTHGALNRGASEPRCFSACDGTPVAVEMPACSGFYSSAPQPVEPMNLIAALASTLMWYAKVRHVWTKSRQDGKVSCQGVKTLVVRRLRLTINESEAEFLRRLVHNTKSKRYMNRRWAPLIPETATVIDGGRSTTHDSALVAGLIQRRMFAVTSGRLSTWKSPPKRFWEMPYRQFGRGVSKKQFPAMFRKRVNIDKGFRKRLVATTFSRRRPLCCKHTTKGMHFKRPTWVSSVVRHDFVGLRGRRDVCLCKDYQRATHQGGGASCCWHKLNDTYLEMIRSRFNASGQGRSHYGSLKRHHIAHAMCEIRQFLFDANRTPPSTTVNFDLWEKQKLCSELAEWLLRNSHAS